MGVGNEIGFGVDGGEEIGIVVVDVEVLGGCGEGEFMGVEGVRMVYFVCDLDFGRVVRVKKWGIVGMWYLKCMVG